MGLAGLMRFGMQLFVRPPRGSAVASPDPDRSGRRRPQPDRHHPPGGRGKPGRPLAEHGGRRASSGRAVPPGMADGLADEVLLEGIARLEVGRPGGQAPFEFLGSSPGKISVRAVRPCVIALIDKRDFPFSVRWPHERRAFRRLASTCRDVVIAVADLRTDLGVLHRILLPGSPSRHAAGRAVPFRIRRFIIPDGRPWVQAELRDFFRDSGFHERPVDPPSRLRSGLPPRRPSHGTNSSFDETGKPGSTAWSATGPITFQPRSSGIRQSSSVCD